MSAAIVSFAAVKRAVRIEAVLDRYGLLAGLVLRGANLTGRCPFCSARSERAFRVSPEKNAWYCFGCKQGGNVLDFVARRENVTMRAAAVTLDEWFGLGLAPRSESQETERQPNSPAAAPEEVRANEPLTFALKTLDPANASVAALGLSAATVSHFGLGFCSKGLLKGRIAVPIRNRKGDLLAYAGLAADLAAADRYLFPPKFHPELEVFNTDHLSESAAAGEPTYLASEILGVLRLTDAGIEPVLGLFHGTLSEPQARALAQALPADSRLHLAGAFESAAIARLTDHFAVRSLSFDAVFPEATPAEPPG